MALFAATALLVAAIAGGGAWLRSTLYFDVLQAKIASGGAVVRGGDNGTVILSGDSQAAMYGTEIGSLARAQGFTLFALGTAGRNQLPEEEGTSWPTAATLIDRKQPDLVILIDAWADKLSGDPHAVDRAITRIGGHARHILIVAEPPLPPDSANRAAIRKGVEPPFLEPAADRARRLAVLAQLRALADHRVDIVDVAPLLLDSTGAIRLIGSDGRLLYFDQHHLSDSGTRLVRPMLDRAIRKGLAR